MKQFRELITQWFFENNEKLTIELQLLKLKIDDQELNSLDKAIEVVGIPISFCADGNSLVKE